MACVSPLSARFGTSAAAGWPSARRAWASAWARSLGRATRASPAGKTPGRRLGADFGERGMSMAERESLGATLKAYEKLREADESRWPELMLAAVTCKGPEPIGPNDAAERLRATANGWVRHRSGARRLGEP